MATIVQVKAANVSKFWHTPEVKGYINFPETAKTYPMNWSFDDHRFMFDGLTDSEVVDLAKKCKLPYEEGVNKGKSIDAFDLNYREDPFFNHSRMRIKIADDITTFNLKNPLEKLLLAGFKSYPFVAKSENDKANVASVKWIIIDKETESTDKENFYLSEKNVWKYFTGTDKERLNPTTMRAILLAFNDKTLKIDNSVSAEALETMLMNKIKEPKTSSTISGKQKFLMLAALPKEELQIRAMIGTAAQLGILRKMGDKWLYGGSELANSTDTLVQLLKSPDYSSTYIAIKQEIELKK